MRSIGSASRKYNKAGDMGIIGGRATGGAAPSRRNDHSSGAGGSGSKAGLGSSNSSGGPRDANTGGRCASPKPSSRVRAAAASVTTATTARRPPHTQLSRSSANTLLRSSAHGTRRVGHTDDGGCVGVLTDLGATSGGHTTLQTLSSFPQWLLASAKEYRRIAAVQRGGAGRIALFQTTPAQFHGRPEAVEAMTQELAGELPD